MGGMGGPPEPTKEVDTEGLYKILGVEKTADQSEIRKAYMKLARKEHPDKGGDPERFKEISKANDILSDPEKRKLYDQYGEEGVESGGGGSQADLFSELFGGGGGRRGRSGPRKGEDIVHHIQVGLEDLFKGKTIKLKVSRDVVCTDCTGSGCVEGAKENMCDECDGRGVKVVIRRMGPMVQQMQQPCGKCRGQGKWIKPQDQCKVCTGRKVKQDKTMIEVVIEKGMRNDDKIVFRGQADEAPGVEPGDLIFVIREAEHGVFKRAGCDLIMRKEISLREALTGVRFVVTHLDGTPVIVTSSPGQVVSPGDVLAVVGKGMPMKGNPFVKGDLCIKFDVKFPKAGELTAAQLTVLREALPATAEAGPATPTDEDTEVTVLTEVDEDAVRERQRQMRAEHDSDEEGGHGGGQRVQCAQQ